MDKAQYASTGSMGERKMSDIQEKSCGAGRRVYEGRGGRSDMAEALRGTVILAIVTAISSKQLPWCARRSVILVEKGENSSRVEGEMMTFVLEAREEAWLTC